MPKRYEGLEIMRKKASMSQQIVSQKDKEYAWYAGASLDDADKMAKIDTMLKHGLIPKDFIPFVKLYRSFLNQRRKAFFASVGCTEISKLGFLLGLKSVRIKASK